MSNPEEKNEDNTPEVNSNVDTNQEEQNEKTPFEGEDILDINQEEKSEDETVAGKQSRTIRMLVLVVVLLLPIIYIFYKTMGSSTTAQQPANQPPPVDFAAMENIVKAAPTYPNLLNLANAYINNRMASKSIDPLMKAIALSPKSAAAYSDLGFAYTIMEQYQKGIEACEKAVELDSTFLLAKNNLNWAKSEQKKLLDAAAEMEKTPEDKRTTSFYVTYGLLYLRLQDYDKSIDIWNKILVTDPKNSAALNNIGIALMSKFEYDKAIKSFKKAVDSDANDQLAKNNLAWALDEKSKVDSVKTK